MTKIKGLLILAVLLLVGFLLVSPVLAAAAGLIDISEEVTAADLEISQPVLLPGNPFYFLKEWVRKIRLGLTFNEIKKEKARLKQMNERLIEVKELFDQPADEKSKKVIARALEEYQKQAEKFTAKIKEIRKQVRDSVEAREFLEKEIDWEVKRQQLLEEMENKAVAEIKIRLQAAMDSSLAGLVQTTTLVSNPTDLENIFDMAANKVEQKGKIYYIKILQKLQLQLPRDTQQIVERVQSRTLEGLKKSLEKVDEITEDNLMNEFIEEGWGT